ncbi:MAG: hypothetical protein R3F59_38725 [Myxococcota bacterium]
MSPTSLAPLMLALAGPAWAHGGHHGPDHNQIEGVRVEAHGSVSPYTVFGVGGRLEVPLVPDGFIGGDVHDELALSLGADGYFAELNPGWYDGGVYVVPVAALQWNFYAGDWSIFPEGGVAFHVHPDGTGWDGRQAIYAEPDVGIGARYHFADRNALLLRASTPGGIQVGLTF